MRRRTLPLVVALAVSALTLVACTSPSAAGAGRSDARILQGSPATLDPAATGDAGSAAVIAQLFETLTVYDEAGELRPALAASWTAIIVRVRDEVARSGSTQNISGYY